MRIRSVRTSESPAYRRKRGLIGPLCKQEVTGILQFAFLAAASAAASGLILAARGLVAFVAWPDEPRSVPF